VKPSPYFIGHASPLRHLARILLHALAWVIGSLLAALFFPLPPAGLCADFPPVPPDGITQSALPQRGVSLKLTNRVLLRLEQIEAAEPNRHFQTDIRIAWLTVLYASRGESEPHVAATAKILGVHPDRVFSKIEAMRMAKLGPVNYEAFFGAASSPKKPPQSVKLPDLRKSGREEREG
jgi:hypothetical protein